MWQGSVRIFNRIAKRLAPLGLGSSDNRVHESGFRVVAFRATGCFRNLVFGGLGRGIRKFYTVQNPQGPCTQIVYTLYLHRDYFKADVYTYYMSTWTLRETA